MPPAPMADPSAMIQGRGRYLHATSVIGRE
jgi:hypothetical protein